MPAEFCVNFESNKKLCGNYKHVAGYSKTLNGALSLAKRSKKTETEAGNEPRDYWIQSSVTGEKWTCMI